MTRIISADCHINEPPWVFDRVPDRFKENAPRMMRGDDGGDGWSFDGGPPKRTFGLEAMAGRAKDQFVASGLKFDEVNHGWVPFWMQTMDETYECEKAWADLPITRKPSECCGTNVFVTSLDDYVGYDLIRAGWPQLADMVMYSTDYPHSLCLWPQTKDYVEKLMHGLTVEQKEKICSGNAARVYGL